MSPTGFRPSRAAAAIYRSLFAYEEATGRGFACTDNVGYVVDLPNRGSFSPDASFFVGEPSGMQYLDGAPVFAAEVRSANDYGAAAEASIAQKRADYFAAGTQVVWDVDLQADAVIRAYQASQPEQPTIFRRGDQAETGRALPGWTFEVNALFQ